jgi:hypothetical protein
MLHARAIAIAPLLVILAGSAALAGDDGSDKKDHGNAPKPFTYAVIGDTPYGAPQLANFPNDIAEINADGDVRLILHVGDIKNGSSVCSDGYFQSVKDGFGSSVDPLVYTPGDNEWTDCHRTNNGAYNPLERLAKVREVFFPVRGQTLGSDPREVRAQRGTTLENVTWKQGRVQFATIHVVGSNNSWLPWTGQVAPTQAQIDEYTARNAADLAWLDRVFDEGEDARAIVIGIQADMWDAAFSGPNDQPAAYDHFTDFVQKLARKALRFGKPVLLINGDSHVFTDDFPLAASAPAYQRSMYGVTTPVPNLRRITTNGSTTKCHEWIKLTVDASTPSVFSYDRVLYHKQPGFDHTACPES